MTGRIGVVVPARDAADTVATAVASARADPSVFEVVVVDDASQDATAAVAAGAGARVVATGPAGAIGAGPSAARNVGVAALDPAVEVVGFLDADDLWCAPAGPDPRLARLDADPPVDLVHGLVQVERDGSPVGEPTVLGALHGLLVRRDALARVGGFDEQRRQGEDVEWLLRVRRAGVPSATVEVVAYRYRLRPGSTSSGEGVRAASLLAAVRSAVASRREGPAVAVVVPVRDGARYLAEALESVRNQTVPPTELVVVDDGSTDGSAAIARRFGARVVVLPESRGPNAARNEGVRLATADLVAFLDADDRWPREHLAVLLAALDGAPGAVAAMGSVQAFVSPDRPDLAGAAEGGARTGPVAGALVVRRSALVAAGGWREDLLTGEVAAFLRVLGAAGHRVATVDDVVLERRIHGANLTITRAAEVHAAYLKLARENLR